MEKATARTVVNTGEYQAHPRRTPLNPRAAPATATATAVAITQGWAPGPSGRDAVPGTGPSVLPVPAGAGAGLRAALRCEGHGRPPAPRRTSAAADIPGSACVEGRPRVRQRAPGGYRHGPPSAQPQRLQYLGHFAGLVCLVRDQQREGVRAEPGGRGQRPGLGRGQAAQDRQDGPRSRWAESLSIRASSKACGQSGPAADPAAGSACRRSGGLPPRPRAGLGPACGHGAVGWGWVWCGPESWMAARLSAMDCSPAVPVYSSASGSGADGECRKAGAPAAVQEPQRVVAFREVRADRHRRRDSPLEGIAGQQVVAVPLPAARVAAGGMGTVAEHAVGVGREPLVQDDGRLGGRDGFLLPHHEGPVAGGRGPVHPAQRIPVAVFAGHDVVVAGIGPGPRGCDTVVSAGTGEPRLRQLDGGGRHGEEVAVVDRVAVEGQPEGIAEFRRDGPDQELAAPGRAEVVLIAAGAAGCRTGREPEDGRFAEPGRQVFLHDRVACARPRSARRPAAPWHARTFQPATG